MANNNIAITESVTIKIPELKIPRVFLQISDAHIAYAYEDDTNKEKDLAAYRSKEWNQADIAPIDAFDSFIRLANEKKPDAVLFAGDMIDYYSESNVRFLAECLARLEVDHVYVWGNHGNGTYGLAIPDMSIMKAGIAPLMGGNTEFLVKDYGEFLLVALNNGNLDVSDECKRGFERAVADGRPIILLMHVPVGTDEFSRVAWSTLDDDELSTQRACEFAQFLKSPDSHVVAILAGHEHFAWSGEFAFGRMQYVSAPCFKRFVREIRVEPLE